MLLVSLSQLIFITAFEPGTQNVFTDRTLYVVILALLMFPLCIKKMLAEMKIVSILLFMAIAIFIFLFLV